MYLKLNYFFNLVHLKFILFGNSSVVIWKCFCNSHIFKAYYCTLNNFEYWFSLSIILLCNI